MFVLFTSDSHFLQHFHIDFNPDAGFRRYIHCAIRIDDKFRLDDIFLVIPFTGRDVAR